MNRNNTLHLVLGCAIGLGVAPAWADDLCPEPAKKAAANALLKQAEDLERAGKIREAFTATTKVDSECVSDYTRHDTLQKRLAKTLRRGREEGKLQGGI